MNEMDVRLSREMRLVDITMIGVGAMIGAGIFVLTGIAAGVAGPALLLVFGLNGLVALLTAMAYAELGSAFHDAGGGYLWVKTSLPDPNGFLSGWMSWFAHAVACSLYALGFGAYFRLVLEALGAPSIRLSFLPIEKLLAVAVCLLFAYINFRGASETGKAGNVVTVAKVVVIGLFVAVGLWATSRRPDWQAAFRPFLSNGWGGVFGAMGLTFIAFEGYEIIAQTSEEVENPKRNVPRAVFLSLLIVVPIYLLVAFVAVGATSPPAGMSVTEFLGREKETALVTAAGQLVHGGGFVILVGGLLSTLSALNATIYSSSRVAFAMGRDANLPQLLSRVHPTRATPYVAVLFSTALIVAMAVSLPIEDVAAAADIMFLLLFVQVNVAVIRLRRSRPDLDRGFRVPFMPFTPIAAIGTMLFLAVFLFTRYPKAWLAAGGWILVGAGVYYAYSRKKESVYLERREWMERIEREEYGVLVAIANPRNIPSLLEAGLAIARRHRGDLTVLHVVEVPEGVSLLSGRRRAREAEPLLEKAVAYAAEHGVFAHPVVRIGHRVSQAILETAREEDCNFLILGRPETHSFFERIVASIVERVLDDAPCRVGVVFGAIRPDGVRRVLVPVTESANSRLAAELAPAFTERFGARAKAVTVVRRGTSEAEIRKAEAAARKTVEEAELGGGLEVLRRRETARGLADAVRRGDLVVMGAPSHGPVAGLLGETVPAAIAARSRSPVFVVRDVARHRAGRFERVFFERS
jgi:amino acid transporter/nucleotide-binding universal stress UspA family protein